ncbi:MAG: antitoxin [Bryobacteraceae bacterium]|jgi:antitoxin ChpS
MLAVPPALLAILHLRPGAKVGIAVEGGRLVVEPQQRPRYTLDELLAQCDPKALRTKGDREWLDSKPVGGELI